MPEAAPVFDQATARERAAALAGYLAERGVVTILLATTGVTRTLHARVTDLPGELVRAGTCRVESAAGTFEVTPGAIRRV
jgi:hypothetical protein